MKRYKLLKDLPTFKAGDLFYISEHGALVHDGGDVGVTAYARRTLDMFPNILTEWFEEVQEESTNSVHWKPEKGDNYFYIVHSYNPLNNEVLVSTWIDDGHDKTHYLLGNIYRSHEEAEKARNRELAEVRLRRTSNFEPDWSNNDQNKWTVYYNHNDKELLVEATAFLQYPSAIYFDTYDSIKKSIKNHKKEWLIYLGVEDN